MLTSGLRIFLSTRCSPWNGKNRFKLSRKVQTSVEPRRALIIIPYAKQVTEKMNVAPPVAEPSRTAEHRGRKAQNRKRPQTPPVKGAGGNAGCGGESGRAVAAGRGAPGRRDHGEEKVGVGSV